MAIVLPAPTVTLGGAFTAGTVLPASEATSIAAGGAVQFANNGAMFLRVVIASVGTTITHVLQRTVEGQVPAAFTQVLSTTTAYIFPPYSPSDFNDVNGLVNLSFSGTPTGATAGLYFVPAWRT